MPIPSQELLKQLHQLAACAQEHVRAWPDHRIVSRHPPLTNANNTIPCIRDLSYNQIPYIGPSTFLAFPYLSQLYICSSSGLSSNNCLAIRLLSHNMITSLDAYAFQTITAADILSLSIIRTRPRSLAPEIYRTIRSRRCRLGCSST